MPAIVSATPTMAPCHSARAFTLPPNRPRQISKTVMRRRARQRPRIRSASWQALFARGESVLGMRQQGAASARSNPTWKSDGIDAAAESVCRLR
jgi:hypothetical protein